MSINKKRHHYHFYSNSKALRRMPIERPIPPEVKFRPIGIIKLIQAIFDRLALYAGRLRGLRGDLALVQLNLWMDNRPVIRDAIIWESFSGTERLYTSYGDWTTEQKQDLLNTVNAARRGIITELTDPPPNLYELSDLDYPDTALSAEHAWRLYSSHVAHSICVEMLDLVNWSLNNYSAQQLRNLFDSRSLFSWNIIPTSSGTTIGYAICRDFDNVYHNNVTLPAPPDYLFTFMEVNNLIGPDRIQTIGRVLNWCRENMVHFGGGITTKNMEDQWQYRGYPPASRVIEGTSWIGHPESGVRNRTAGCTGTASFLGALLRVVNIPAFPMYIPRTGHTTPNFISDGFYLSHGDDPYSALSKSTPPFPAEELLIDQSTYDSWFSASVPDEDCNINVGRRCLELAIEYLPNYLLRLRCSDRSAGLTNSESGVYNTFKDIYTVDELETVNLWSRLDDKINSLGGCNNIH